MCTQGWVATILIPRTAKQREGQCSKASDMASNERPQTFHAEIGDIYIYTRQSSTPKEAAEWYSLFQSEATKDVISRHMGSYSAIGAIFTPAFEHLHILSIALYEAQLQHKAQSIGSIAEFPGLGLRPKDGVPSVERRCQDVEEMRELLTKYGMCREKSLAETTQTECLQRMPSETSNRPQGDRKS